MDQRYQLYNEITFLKLCFDRIKSRGSNAKRSVARRLSHEVPLSCVPNSVQLYLVAEVHPREENEPVIFNVREHHIEVHNRELGEAIRRLQPKHKAIILLYYFANMTDAEIGQALSVGKSTIQRRRTEAQKQLKGILRSFE